MTHRSALIDYAAAIVGCRARAEDVVQEAWLRYEAAAAGRALDQPQGYLYRVVRNLALDLARRSRLESRHFDQGPLPDMAADLATPESDALHRQELALVREALADLPPRTRAALEMHRIGGHKLKDIAAHLGISVGLAHALVYQGLDHCRTRLRRGR
ncbi:MAG TPA: sigma-70 family RNA polymerase sigma factor [Dongiaceae bacterium]|nr:sigma-70 family RNA polymerase sigma factor [Dongiaceae bacterium]